MKLELQQGLKDPEDVTREETDTNHSLFKRRTEIILNKQHRVK